MWRKNLSFLEITIELFFRIFDQFLNDFKLEMEFYRSSRNEYFSAREKKTIEKKIGNLLDENRGWSFFDFIRFQYKGCLGRWPWLRPV